MEITFIGAIGLFNFIACSLFLCLVFRYAGHSNLVRYFLLWVLALAIFSFFYFLWQALPGLNVKVRCFYGLIGAAILINIPMMHLCEEVSERKRHKNFIILFFDFWNLAFFFTAFGPFYEYWEFKYSYGYWPHPSALGNIYIAVWFIQVLYIFSNLFVQGVLNRQHSIRSRAKIVLLGCSLGYLGGATNWFLWYEINIPPYANCGITICIIIIGYAIFKHQILDVKMFIRKTIFYSISAIGMSIFYVMIVFGVYKYVSTDIIANPSLLSSASIIVFIAMTIKPIDLLFQQYLGKLFLKGSIEDIVHHREELEGQLLQSERLKSVGILAAGMAHEIRNPIQSLKTFGEYLDKKYDDESYRSKFQELIFKETTRIEKLTTDLLEFSKPKEPNRQKTDLLHLINEVMELVSNELMKLGIDYKVNASNESVYATVDSDQIKQVLLNLVLNARDAMQDSPKKVLTISLDYKTLSIQDSGCGIAPDKIPHLFDPFYTSKEKGTGLGLAITHSLIEKNGGKIIVESGRLGSIFTIIFNSKVGF